MWPDLPRIVLIGGDLSPRSGGIARSVLAHAAMLAERGAEVLILGVESPGLAADTDDPLPTGVHAQAYRAACSARESVPSELLDDLEEMLDRVAMVHLNGHWRPLNHAIGELCRRRQVPYIVSCRCELSGAERFFRSTSALLDMAAAESELIAGAHALHMTSELELRTAVFPAGCDPPTVVIPNVVELDARWLDVDRCNAREQLGLDRSAVVLLFFGRVVAEKNPEWLVEMLAWLDEDERLCFVGPVEQAQRASLLARARALGVESRIQLHGYVGGLDRALWLRAADLFLLPSCGENFCLALVEALACGTPALTSPFVGALEFLSDQHVAAEELEVSLWARRCRELVAAPRRRAPLAELAERFAADRVLSEWSRVMDFLDLDAATPASHA